GQCAVRELELHVLKLKHALVLLNDGVARTGENLDECSFVEIIEDADDGQTADEFRDQAEADKILRFGFLQQLSVTLAGFGKLALFLLAGAEAHGLFADTTGHNLFQADESAAADKQDVGGIDRCEFLVRMLASTLRRHVGDGAFKNLEKSLLNAFTANVAG